MTKLTVEPKGWSIVGCGYVYGECNLLRGYAQPGPHLTGGGILVDSLWGAVMGAGRQRGREVFWVEDTARTGRVVC